MSYWTYFNGSTVLVVNDISQELNENLQQFLSQAMKINVVSNDVQGSLKQKSNLYLWLKNSNKPSNYKVFTFSQLIGNSTAVDQLKKTGDDIIFDFSFSI